MWYPYTIQINNLFTHEHTSYSFKREKMCVFLGENRDKKQGANSNGSGKSTLIEGITLAITGEVSRGVRKESFIQRGKKHCDVELILKNDVLNKTMKIYRRFFNSSSSSILEVEIDKVQQKGGNASSVALRNKLIYDELGIGSEDLLNYFIIGQDNSSTFFTLTDTKQKEIIARFSNAKIVDTIIDNIKQSIRAKETESIKLDGEITALNIIIDDNNKQLEELKNVEEDDEELNKLKSNIQKYKDNIEKNKADILEFQERLKAITKEIKIHEARHRQDKTPLFKSKIEEHNEKLQRLQDESSDLKGKKSVLKASLSGEVTCPNCNKPFLLNTNKTKAEVQKELNTIDAKIDSNKEEVERLNDIIENLQELIDNEVSLKRKLKQMKTQSGDLTDDIFNMQENNRSYRNKIAKLKQDIENMKESVLDMKAIARLEAAVTEKQAEMKEVQEKKDIKMKEIDEYKQLMFHMGRSGFKTYLTNMSIDNIQNLTNYYLNKFNTDLAIKISGARELKDGTTSDKIDIKITRDDEEDDFKAYSGGEKSKVSVCGILAFHTLINNSVEYGKGLDFLALDETIAYLDAEGEVEALKIIEKSEITSVVVMHKIDDLSLPNRVLFVKEQGVTKILSE